MSDECCARVMDQYQDELDKEWQEIKRLELRLDRAKELIEYAIDNIEGSDNVDVKLYLSKSLKEIV